MPQFETTSTPAPEGSGGFWVQVKPDNFELFAKYWEPSTPIKANVTFVHGLGEHILRYEHVFSKFAAAGIRVFAFDQRGFGNTVKKNCLSVEGGRACAMVLGDNQGWDVALDDILAAIRFSRQDGIPHFLFGHSMGGLLAINAAIKFKDQLKLAGLIASAPGLRPGFPVPYLKRTIGSWVSKILGSFNIESGVDANGISRDPAVVEIYKNDPLVHSMGSLRTCIFHFLDSISYPQR